jgi:hypothetical protein
LSFCNSRFLSRIDRSFYDRRQNMDEVTKIKEQIASIWEKAKEAQGL